MRRVCCEIDHMLSPTDISPTASVEVSIPDKRRPCKCSRRFTCDACHRYWVGKRWRKARLWLEEVRTENTIDLFGTLTVPDRSHWTETLSALLKGWASLGEARRREKRKVHSEHPLAALSRGIAAIHLHRQDEGIRPHLHTLLVYGPDDFDSDIYAVREDLCRCWQDACSGIEYADFTKAVSRDAVLRYAIGKGLPASREDRKALERILKGMHMVRRIGQVNAPTK
jgi:hypothetical protein